MTNAVLDLPAGEMPVRRSQLLLLFCTSNHSTLVHSALSTILLPGHLHKLVICKRNIPCQVGTFT